MGAGRCGLSSRTGELVNLSGTTKDLFFATTGISWNTNIICVATAYSKGVKLVKGRPKLHSRATHSNIARVSNSVDDSA